MEHPERNRRAILQVAARHVQAQHLVGFQVNKAATSRVAEWSAIMPEQVNVADGFDPTQLPEVDALDVVQAAKHVDDGVRFATAGIGAG